MSLDWEDLRTVLALVRAGTLAAAGAALGVNYTTVARRVQRAEAAIGATLFERLATGYQPTEAGRLLARHAEQMEGHQNDLLRQLRGRDQSLTGPLVITAPQLLIGPVLAPVLDRFSTRHPDVDLRLRATNDLLDLTRREADLAIRISRTPGDTLTGLRLSAQHSASFASTDNARHIETHPDAPVDWIVYEHSPKAPKAARDLRPGARVRMVFDDMAAMLGAACAGLGVVRMPMFLGRSTPGLVQVSMLPPQPYMDVWVVGHPDVWRSAKVAAFRAELVPHFRALRPLFVADDGSDRAEQPQRQTNG